MPVVTRSQVPQSRATLSPANVRSKTSPLAARYAKHPLTERLSQSLWTTWTNWFHAFYAEVEEEGHFVKSSTIFHEAYRRWTLFAMRQHRISSADVMNWLGSNDSQALLDAFQCSA
jgi:hypothetical protein